MNQSSDIKMVLVTRKDLNMRKGKMIAQNCHACLGIFLDISKEYRIGGIGFDVRFPDNNADDIMNWLYSGTAKISVSCDSLEELLELEQKAKDAGILTHKVVDAGLTEFGGIPTITVLAIGPAKKVDLDPITGYLKLL